MDLLQDYKGFWTLKVKIVILTALGVGGATIFGAVLGLIFKKTTERRTNAVIAFAAGVMMAAAMIGLIFPALEYGGKYGVITATLGIFLGALSVNLLDMLLPCIMRLGGHKNDDEGLRGVFLFVGAIAIHNLPEGIAAGVGFGTGEIGDAILIATAVALQNIPEGMIVFLAMLGAGISRGRTFFIAAMTGVVEIIGTFIGYFAVSISSAVLPFALAFAGGTMLYVISDELIPDTHSREGGHLATYFLLIGFTFMLIFDAII